MGNREHRDVRTNVARGASCKAQQHPQTFVADGERTVPRQRRTTLLAACRRPQPRYSRTLSQSGTGLLRGDGGIRTIQSVGLIIQICIHITLQGGLDVSPVLLFSYIKRATFEIQRSHLAVCKIVCVPLHPVLRIMNK